MKTLENQVLELEARIKALEEKMSRIKHDSFRQPLRNGAYKPIGLRSTKK